jgi:mRNA interferase YafQ
MRTISRTSRFKKDYKREAKGPHRPTLDADMLAVVALLASNTPLPEKLHDHPLAGEWIDHRDCHIKPDLVLIYREPDEASLELVRLGSHGELSL